jgi:hypothetical protein
MCPLLVSASVTVKHVLGRQGVTDNAAPSCKARAGVSRFCVANAIFGDSAHLTSAAVLLPTQDCGGRVAAAVVGLDAPVQPHHLYERLLEGHCGRCGRTASHTGMHCAIGACRLYACLQCCACCLVPADPFGLLLPPCILLLGRPGAKPTCTPSAAHTASTSSVRWPIRLDLRLGLQRLNDLECPACSGGVAGVHTDSNMKLFTWRRGREPWRQQHYREFFCRRCKCAAQSAGA